MERTHHSHTTEEQHMSKKKKSSKVVIFNLTMPKTEIPFARLSTPLKRFGKLREAFEVLGLRVEIVDFRK